ncbi:hypothetical protein [Lelliottia sp.]|uniref:hypothetical protein n=1 Tax=Lelliottia sp. TaxID=1898429 RepID=UPI00388D38F2
MAIISCFSQPESLRGVLVCLNDTGGIAGLCAVALGLGVWIVAQMRSEAAAKKRLAKIMKYGKPGISSPPTFGGQQHAEAVHLFANRDYYQFLLSEFEKALLAQGYELTADSSRHVVPDSESTCQVARAIMIARERYMAPLQSDTMLEEKADECARAGYSHQWFCLLVAGSEKAGWYITRSTPATGSE